MTDSVDDRLDLGDVGLGGEVESGFERVRDAFAQNFTQRGDVGAAFAVTRDGRPVVDLWGGIADVSTGRPWQADTMQVIFSGTKGLTALCMSMLIDRGTLMLDDPVCAHWPEFAANGKDEVTIAEIVSHRGRMPGLLTAVSEHDILDAQQMATLLAAQAQETDPRAEMIYHPLTYGWLCGEIVRRVDGRSIGRFFDEEVARPLGLELWIGLPADHEPRVARLEHGPDWSKHLGGRVNPFPGDRLWASIYENPTLFATEQPKFWNTQALHACEMPGANAIGTARSVARLYGALACGGQVDGVRIISERGLQLAGSVLSSGSDPLTEEEASFGIGFSLQTDDASFGPVRVAFGHGGAGGSLHGTWPDERIGFSYAMNQMRNDPEGDERVRALLDALYECVQ